MRNNTLKLPNDTNTTSWALCGYGNKKVDKDKIDFYSQILDIWFLISSIQYKKLYHDNLHSISCLFISYLLLFSIVLVWSIYWFYLSLIYERETNSLPSIVKSILVCLN